MGMRRNRRAQQAGAVTNRLRADLRVILGQRRRPAVARASFPRALSHYELLEKIGTGGRGTVYLARDMRLDRLVAIKTSRSRLCAKRELRQRFLSEAKCASAINHPNVVTVHDVGCEQGTDFLVMEYVQGRTIDRIIPKCGLALEVCLNYALQMAWALAAIHSEGMIHRDLKPSNFVIAKTGAVKLLDFGLAKLIRSNRPRKWQNRNSKTLETQEGTILGTVGYMSPEQVRGQAADQRSDIFSFGVIFYEMLTGRRAFQEHTPIETMSAILHKAVPKCPARVPTPVATIVGRCLQKDANRRYRTAKELVSALALAVPRPGP